MVHIIEGLHTPMEMMGQDVDIVLVIQQLKKKMISQLSVNIAMVTKMDTTVERRQMAGEKMEKMYAYSEGKSLLKIVNLLQEVLIDNQQIIQLPLQRFRQMQRL